MAKSSRGNAKPAKTAVAGPNDCFIFNNMPGSPAIAAIFYLGLFAGYTRGQMFPDSLAAMRERIPARILHSRSQSLFVFNNMLGNTAIAAFFSGVWLLVISG